MSTKPSRSAVVCVVLLTLLASMIPTGFAFANDTTITFTAQYRQDQVVQLDAGSASQISSLDPQVATDTVSITIIENLFLGLTNVDPITGATTPEIATDWSVSDDGLTWTFNLRDDVMWYRYDPESGNAEELRPVVGADFVYGVKRGCDPRHGSLYGAVVSAVIAGCDVVNATPSEDLTDDFVYGDTTKVVAPDDTTVEITLNFPAGFFLSMTPMWVVRAVPQEIIEEYGDDWTEPGNIVTNGPYFVEEVVRGVRRIFVRNTSFNEDLLSGTGNIERVVTQLVEDVGTRFALYQDDQLDTTAIPNAELQAVLDSDEYSNDVHQIFDSGVRYFAFTFDKAPFDDVHVRRAFNAIIDRDAFTNQVMPHTIPMIHFIPPGMFGAPPINEIGVGFNPDYAREQMAMSAYPDCDGFPDIEILTFASTADWGEFLASAAEEHLGCEPERFLVQALEFSVLLQATHVDNPVEERPNMWTGGWGPDYGDAHNWVFDAGLSCRAENRQHRPCSEVDDLIDEAARESDPNRRIELYAEIEDAFYGEDGVFPIAPLYLGAFFTLYKTWYTGPFETDGIFGGQHWDARSIDMAAKLAARGA